MAATVEQPTLFDLPQTSTATKPAEQPPLDGSTTWRVLSRRAECVDCWHQQATDHAAGRTVARRERARLQMTTGTDSVELCERHAWARGWPGRTHKTSRR